MDKVFFIALAGGCGALCRYGLTALVLRFFQGSFPLATLITNLMGCFLFGLCFGLLESKFPGDTTIKLIILVGFLGAFTTFSSFAFENVLLLRSGLFLPVLGNIIIQNIFGLVLMAAGLAIANLLRG